MKTKLKAGDKVAVYDSRLEGRRSVGIVSSFTGPNKLEENAIHILGVVRMDGYDEIIVHRKQVRKIKESK